MNNIKPIKSASIILQKTTGEVFLGKRSMQVSFFPGFWVFPGGKIEEDLKDDWDGTEFEVIDTIFQELYEETGIIVGSDYIIPPNQRSEPYFVHNYNDDKRREFKELMEYVGKKDTPPFRRKIYSAAYYHIRSDLVDELNPQVDGNELVEGQWIMPDVAIEKWHNGEIRLPPPILHILRNMKTEHFASINLNETFLPIGLQTKIEFTPGIQLIPITSNTIDPFFNTNLVVIGDKAPLIVDPGANEMGSDHFRQILLSLPSFPNVILTHHHKDHWEGLSIVEEIYPEAIVFAHPNTLNKIKTNLKTQPVEHKEQLKIDNLNLEVIYLPGHTDGHIGIYCTNNKAMIAGDHVVGFGSAVLDPEFGSMIDYFDSTRKLQKMDLDIVLPAHGPPNFHPQKLLQTYIEHRQKREDDIWLAVEGGNHDLDSIVSVVYQDVPEKMWPYAKRNIQLHLQKLATEKKLPDGLEF